MAKRKRATNHSDFAGPDADREAIEKLSSAAAKENAKAGHNSGRVPDEVLERNTTLIKAAKVELDEMLSEVAKLRGVLGNRKKVAKKDGCNVRSIMRAIELEKEAATGGTGSIVSEHRDIGRVLRILNCPLGTQLSFFDDDATAEPKSEANLEAEATLAGEHAGLNGEPKENNPHIAGTQKWFGWNNGWQIGADKLTDSFASGKAPEAAGSPAH